MRVFLLLAFVVSAVSPQQKLAIETVKAQLKDPDSARFKGLRIEKDGSGCGWVNAKNTYGGYTGFQVFYIGKNRKVVLLTPELSEPGLC